MFFLLSKALGTVAWPVNLILIAAVIGLVFLPTRFGRVGKRLLICAALSLFAIAVMPIGPALTATLEGRFPGWVTKQDSGRPPDGVIVLGGVISPELSAARGSIVLSDAAERLTEVVVLARRYPGARIIFVGGDARALGGPSEATFAKELFESLGIPPSRIEFETQSRNTAENARFAKTLINPKPAEHWLLVTSAMHMPRAIGSFRKAGFPVEAYPVDWQTRGFQDLLSVSMPPRALNNVVSADNAVHEWIGLLVYWWLGLTSELFPGPHE